jgi:hypothetical protein
MATGAGHFGYEGGADARLFEQAAGEPATGQEDGQADSC